MGGILGKEDVPQFCETVKCAAKESQPWYSDIKVDWNGCRKFNRLPPKGQHPRLFFTEEELPWVIARYFDTPISDLLKKNLENTVRDFLKYHSPPFEDLTEDDTKEPLSREIVDKFFKPDVNRNDCIIISYVYGLLYSDVEVAKKAKKAALFYARVVLRSKELARQEEILDKPYNVWHGNEFDLQVAHLFGGTPFALFYDLSFNELSADEQTMFRKFLATCTRGRRGWGMGWSTRRIQSNWAPYHSDLFIMTAAIEGEEGFDGDVYSIFSDLMAHYMDYAFYDSGHPMEDAYVLNLGFREGSICFLAMARRGHNIFNHPKYKKLWVNWVPLALEPHNNGKIYGGSSGSYWIYPTSAIITKFMFPKDPVIDFVYEHHMCENGKKFSRFMKMQTRVAAIAFAIPSMAGLDGEENPGELGLPLDFVCRDRGKVISRSDWTTNAMWFTFDARPDGFLIGHDSCSRGTFVLNADGRAWGICPEWKHYKESNDYSLTAIDGKGQRDKAPFVKLLDIKVEKEYTFSSADLTYAYNWKWTTWAREYEDYSKADWEHEPNNPRDFGCTLWWLPSKLYDEPNVGFSGLHQWRKRIAHVEKVTRSCLFVRATRPFVIIADVAKKDNKECEYSWSMTTPDDVELLSFEGTDAVLKEIEESGRRFLIRALHETESNLECEFRALEKVPKNASRDDKAKQVTLKSSAITGAKTAYLLFSLPRETSEPLETTWIMPGKKLRIHDPEAGETRHVVFGNGSTGETTMTVLSEE